MRVLRLPAQSAGILYPQEIPLVLISVTDGVDTQAIVRPERLGPNDPIGNQTCDVPVCSTVLEPATAYPRSHKTSVSIQHQN